jgi:peroxiredoxin
MNIMKPLLFLPLVCLTTFLCAGAESIPTLPAGATAPDFDLPGVDGRNWALKDFAKAKVFVVLFTCNHSPTAQNYEDRINQIVSDYKEKGVALIAISPNDPKAVRLDELGWTDVGDSFAEMKVRAEERKYNYPYLYDGEPGVASRAYGPVATPHIFVFDSSRKLRYSGAIDDSERVQNVKKHYVRDAIDALLADKEPPVSQTKVIGCSTKWSGNESHVEAYMAKLAAEPVALTPVDAGGLAALRTNGSGKFRLISFWATWCAPCVAEFDLFVTINRMYRHRDFELVMVSLNQPDEEKRVLEFLKEHQASNRNLIFGSTDREKLMNAFNPNWRGEVPYTVLIDPDGKIVYEESGSIYPLAMKRTIVKAMNERKPW